MIQIISLYILIGYSVGFLFLFHPKIQNDHNVAPVVFLILTTILWPIYVIVFIAGMIKGILKRFF